MLLHGQITKEHLNPPNTSSAGRRPMSSPIQPAKPHEDQITTEEGEIADILEAQNLELGGGTKNTESKEPLTESSSSKHNGLTEAAAQLAKLPNMEEQVDKHRADTPNTQNGLEQTGGPLPKTLFQDSKLENEKLEDDKGPEIPSTPPEELTEQLPGQAESISRPATPPPEPFSEKETVRSPSPPPPPPKDEKYLNSNQDTSIRALTPVAQESKMNGRTSEDPEAAEYNEKYEAGEDTMDDSRSEIQSIMEQFDDGMEGPGIEEIMSPRLEFAGPILDSPIPHPLRKSSLEPLNAGTLPHSGESSLSKSQTLHSPPPRTSSLYCVNTGGTSNEKAPVYEDLSSPKAHANMYKPPPPAPDPEPDLPFDFHRFLEQLRHRTADPVAKFLRSFLLEFGKKQWMVHEQVKIISDFLEFISKKMAQCEVWRTVSDAEFDNAREGMEKLVMNRLYSQTFSPAIPPPEPIQGGKGRRRGAQEPPGQGRRGQHQEDVERDEVLAQKVRIYKWVREEHLDIKPVGEKGRKFLLLAQQGMLKL
jgi:Rab5 GDP/GTP exchange factor